MSAPLDVLSIAKQGMFRSMNMYFKFNNFTLLIYINFCVHLQGIIKIVQLTECIILPTIPTTCHNYKINVPQFSSLPLNH